MRTASIPVATLADRPWTAVRDALRGRGLSLDFGVMSARVRTPIADLGKALHCVYGAFPYIDDERFDDVSVQVVRSPGLKGRLSPSIRFLADGIDPFGAQPTSLTLPQLEWGLNWCFATSFNRHLLLHAGSAEVHGRGLLLVGMPGSGKSTLTAALALAGHRVLSDEFGVLRLADGQLLPFPKPIALKNRSIDLIRGRSDAALFGPTYHKTHKGDVAHLALPPASIQRRRVPVRPAIVVLPRWLPDAATTLERVPGAAAFDAIATNSFNGELLGELAFDAIRDLVRACRVWSLTYSDLDDALRTVERLCDDAR